LEKVPQWRVGKPYFINLMGFVAEEIKHYTVYTSLHMDPS
jgi:hypothetical protein